MTGVKAGPIRNPLNAAGPNDATTPGVENLGDLVTRAASLWPDRVSWRFDSSGEALTFAEVESVTRSLAGSIAAQGIAAGDRVALLARNTVEFPAAWLALARLGAIVVPLNINYRSTDASHVVEQSGAKAILAADEFLGLAGSVATRCPALESVIALEPLVAAWRRGESAALVPVDQVPSQHPVNVQFTSGTTGKPKGCVLPHRYWLSIAWTMRNDFPQLTADDVMLTAQPFHYIDPQWNVAAALLAGAELVVLDRFHPSTFWAKVREYDVTYFYCLGIMPTLLLAMPASENDTRHRVRAVQCSAIPPQRHRELEERWGVPWYEAFGMTETGADIFVGPEEHDELVGTGCLGRPRRHREALVVDEEGKPVPAGRPGELLLRGSGILAGYFEDAESTARAFAGDWFRTGDIVSSDEAGRLYFRSRIKDMIRRSGENISAVEVEEVLAKHESVKLAVVVAVPDEIRGEEILAVIVPGVEVASDEDFFAAIAAHCAAELAYFKVPRYWRRVDSLPLTASERVAKNELVEDGLLEGTWDLRAASDDVRE